MNKHDFVCIHTEINPVPCLLSSPSDQVIILSFYFGSLARAVRPEIGKAQLAILDPLNSLIGRFNGFIMECYKNWNARGTQSRDVEYSALILYENYVLILI